MQRNLPLNDSTKALCVGLPGWMTPAAAPRSDGGWTPDRHANDGPVAFTLVVYPSSMKPLHELTLAEIVAAITHITEEIECLRDAKAPEHEIETIGSLLRALSQERRCRLH